MPLVRALPCVAALALAALLPAGAAPPKHEDMLAEFPHPKGYVCHRAETPIKLDGALNDPAWEVAAWTDAFVDIEGDKQPKPRTARTRATSSFGEKGLTT
jgi:hypothetical protein